MSVRFLALMVCAGMGCAAAAPALSYSTYLRSRFTPNAIATDGSGNIYVAGSVVVDPTAGQTAALVMKLNQQGTQVLYSRYLGGSTFDSASAIAVDGSGNAYVAGKTTSVDFPVTAGGNLGTFATGIYDFRSFAIKLDPGGNVVFSDLLGGSTGSIAQAVAVTAAGQILVSGLSYKSGFPATAGAYAVPDTGNRPYLLELDATGTKVILSATGIGGSALAVDSAGNIYMAGSTAQLDYPTTAGAYQTTFPTINLCLGICQIITQGLNQYVTKVDPSGSQLIYSTSVSGSFTTTNAGLAVDAAGNAYITGFAGEGYPYTVTAPAIPDLIGDNVNRVNIAALPFVSKLDPAGQTLLFSVPVGGAGVQVDAAGALYVGGRVGTYPGFGGSYAVTASLPALANVPTQCLPNGLMILNTAYVSQLDAAFGDALGTQTISGATLSPSAVALAGSTLWIAAATNDPEVPLTAGALIPDSGLPNPALAGAYLGAVDFSQPQPTAGAPQIGCVLDAADFSPAGAVARYQILSIIGSGLGPAAGVSAPDNSTTSLAGVSVNFDSFAAPLLYVSSTQINFAVPLVKYSQLSAAMQVTVNGVGAAPRQFSLTYGNPHFFMNVPETYGGPSNEQFYPLALNADGRMNSRTDPAAQGSGLSVFVNGLAPDPEVSTGPIQLIATNGWTVAGVVRVTPFVLRVDLQVPVIAANANGDLVLFSSGGAPLYPSPGAVFYIK